jgi:1,4-alpha-glucan branching enzyme
VIDSHTGEIAGTAGGVRPDGLFVATLHERSERFPYRLRVTRDGTVREIEDPYRFAALLGELDLHLIAEGSHFELFRKLGAHPVVADGVAGVNFAVWAPNAARVSVVGSFNDWDGRRHPMRCHYGSGVWEIFLPGVERGALYKFEIKPRGDGAPFLKADPLAFKCERAPRTASIVEGLTQDPLTSPSQRRREAINRREAPISIYEVHLGSWRRKADDDNRVLTYDELADELIPYVKEMGFTHLELLPIAEYPFDGSWGYQPLGLFAPTSRFGQPRAFRRFVERCHEAGLGVILDWVPAHFPDDPHGLANFDGTHLYEHADARLGRHKDWGSLIYNYGRREVANFLIANALFWFDQFDIDGLRVDAVASMLYRDYSRGQGEWVANQFGGRENIEAIDFLRWLNHEVMTRFPGAIVIAEESTAWPMVTRPPAVGGLGFSYKWNMGWMHDTLRYLGHDPVHRKYHQSDLTFGLLYAFQENFILPLSHDEVVHGKGALIHKIPGDEWQRFATLRAYLAFMFAYPGKKLLFMGNEFAQTREWNHDVALDWPLLQWPLHRGVQDLVKDLNRLYRCRVSLHLDCENEGFDWIDCHDNDASVVSFQRRARRSTAFTIAVCNFTPVVREAYRIGAPKPGRYNELLNTDSTFYGGSNVGNWGGLQTEAQPMHGFAQSLRLTLPPLATLLLSFEEPAET